MTVAKCPCGHNRYPIRRVVALGTCDRCGQIHQHCSAHKGKTDVPCAGNARVGMTICPKHGGNTRQAKAGAAIRLAEEATATAAAKAVTRLTGNTRPVTDPAAELAALAGEIRAWDRAASALVAELQEHTNPDDDQDTTGLSGLITIGAGGYDVHPLVKLAERSKDRARAVLADMVKLGLAERSVAVEEGQIALMQQALAATLADAGIDPDTVLPALAVKLRELDTIDTDGRET